jgi:hypothetical protein
MDELRVILDELTARVNPALWAAKGVGPDVAAILLVAAGDNPGRRTTPCGALPATGFSPTPRPRPTPNDAPPRARPGVRSCGVSNAASHGKSSDPHQTAGRPSCAGAS